MGSNPVSDKLLFPWARNFTLIPQHWLVPGMDWGCVYKLDSFPHNRTKINSAYTKGSVWWAWNNSTGIRCVQAETICGAMFVRQKPTSYDANTNVCCRNNYIAIVKTALFVAQLCRNAKNNIVCCINGMHINVCNIIIQHGDTAVCCMR